MIEAGKVTVIVGGQFGSEAKGLGAGIVLEESEYGGPLYSTTNAGAQAGHTTVLENGDKFVCYHLPTIGILSGCKMFVNAGAIIDPILLVKEIEDIAAVMKIPVQDLWDRILLHPSAALITPEAKAAEGVQSTGKIGSTMKGVGAALANKIMRVPGSIVDAYPEFNGMTKEMDFNVALDLGHLALTIEIPQGTGLSVNGGMWPTCTSRECWLNQGLTDAQVHPSFLGHTAMVVRTMPIRVGHVYGPAMPGATQMILGHSGPFYPDSEELDWERDLPGIEPERTTVTKRVRRIATFSIQQYERALTLNRPDTVILTFTNYLRTHELLRLINKMRVAEGTLGLNVQHIYSWGPKVSQRTRFAAEVIEYCRKG